MYIILFTAIFILSWSAIIIKMFNGASPLIIAFYRLFFSSIILLPIFIHKNKFKLNFIIKNKNLLTLAGISLALHFYTWISSLQMTSVGHSIFLESIHPVFAYIFSIIFLKEKGNFLSAIGIIVGLSGIFFIAFETGSNNNLLSIEGDILALLSGILFSIYILIARKLRKSTDIMSYVFIIYTISFITLLVIILFGDISLELTKYDFFLLAILTIGPNLGGHTILNWASRKMEIYKVNMALLLEPVLSTIYAAIIFNEKQSALFIIGALLIILSIIIVFKSQRINEMV